MNRTSSQSSIILSVLIPAYNYPAGLDRILSALAPLPNDVEMLVFDDSPEPHLDAIIERYAAAMPHVRYVHNTTQSGAALGAGANWNALLEAARGDYVVLLHHDEVPLNGNFIANLRKRIAEPGMRDAYMLDIIIIDEALRPIRRHLPHWVRRSVPRYLPSYLLRRNVVGPTGTLVIRRSVAPRFDPSLRWLIDVEFYMRFFQLNKDWEYAPDICIGSVQRSEGSITADLSGRIRQIDSAERKSLVARFPEARLWLGAPLGAPIRLLETLAWGSLRIALRLMSWKKQFLKGDSAQ